MRKEEEHRKPIFLDPEKLDAHNWRLWKKYAEISEAETKYETVHKEDAEWYFVAYGTVARMYVGYPAFAEKRRKVGLIRPVSCGLFG